MAQLTLYLEDQLQARLREVAEQRKVSQSQYVADLIRRATAAEWPSEVLATFGAFPDFPSAEELRANRDSLPDDPPRAI